MSACPEIEKIALTHRGFVREVNEDRYYLECLEGQTLLMAVVDGMGGGPAGSAAVALSQPASAVGRCDCAHPYVATLPGRGSDTGLYTIAQRLGGSSTAGNAADGGAVSIGPGRLARRDGKAESDKRCGL